MFLVKYLPKHFQFSRILVCRYGTKIKLISSAVVESLQILHVTHFHKLDQKSDMCFTLLFTRKHPGTCSCEGWLVCDDRIYGWPSGLITRIDRALVVSLPLQRRVACSAPVGGLNDSLAPFLPCQQLCSGTRSISTAIRSLRIAAPWLLLHWQRGNPLISPQAEDFYC